MATLVDNDDDGGAFHGTGGHDSLTDYDNSRILGYGGNDIIRSYAMGFDIGNNQFHQGTPNRSQTHMYGGEGNDELIMAFKENTEKGFSHGHYAFGSSGADDFKFENTSNIKAGTVMVGRIADYDHGNDRIYVDNKRIDLENLPANMKIVNYADRAVAAKYGTQQYLHIKTSTGGDIFYAIEDARVVNGVEIEAHF